MTQTDFAERYSRQIRLAQVGEGGQLRLRDASALIVGVGGLGSPAALYLAAAGVGRLVLADFDRVEESNLQRQIAHRHADIGELKTASAANALRALNPAVEVATLDHVLDADDFAAAAEGVDILLDCSDNFETRFALNRAALRTATPLVCAAAIRFEGQVTAFDPRRADSPCYQCLYPDEHIQAATCEAEGVIAPLVGVLGAMQAMEAVNILLGDGRLPGAVWLFDAQAMEWQRMRLPKNPNCPACG
ncbi:MAG: HesA/MoeB/ThiF family protein [bacterium]